MVAELMKFWLSTRIVQIYYTKLLFANEKIDEIKIAPNPFSNELLLQISEPVFYKVLDILGNQLESGYCNSNLYIGQKLKSGIYILEVRDKNSSKTIKILKR